MQTGPCYSPKNPRCCKVKQQVLSLMTWIFHVTSRKVCINWRDTHFKTRGDENPAFSLDAISMSYNLQLTIESSTLIYVRGFLSLIHRHFPQTFWIYIVCIYISVCIYIYSAYSLVSSELKFESL